MREVHWVATLSDGQTAVENVGTWKIIPGERKPWVRLCEYMEDNGLHLESLRVVVDGQDIWMPMEKSFAALSANQHLVSHYSLSYMVEAEITTGFGNQKTFIDFTTHYYPDDYESEFEVHYIVSLDSRQSWIIATAGHKAIMPSPRKN